MSNKMGHFHLLYMGEDLLVALPIGFVITSDPQRDHTLMLLSINVESHRLIV